MDENKIYDDFLKSLRVAITNSSIYFNEHPIFVKAIADVLAKCEEVFLVLSPLKFGVMPDSLLFGDMVLKESRLYSDIADFFHKRKIKSVIIKQGVTGSELTTFLSLVNLALKDILDKGGAQNTLKESNIVHIEVEELDYSQLLKGEGQECKDVWFYMLKKNLSQHGGVSVEDLADNFGKVLAEFKSGEILTDEKAGIQINNFLVELKKKDKGRFFECAKGLAKLITSDKGLNKEGAAKRLKAFFKDLETDDFSQMLLNNLRKGDDINFLSVKLFSKLFNKDEHSRVAASLANKIKDGDFADNNPKLLKGINDLISSSDAPYIAEIYKNNLEHILENISLSDGVSFDEVHLKNNYRLTLLDLFILETDIEHLSLLNERITQECKECIKNNNFRYLKAFIQAFEKKHKDNPALTDFYVKSSRCVSELIEEAVFNKQEIPDFDYFLSNLEINTIELEAYIKEIVDKNNFNPNMLNLFFKFFKDDLTLFCKNVEGRISNIVFLKRFIEVLSKVSFKECLQVFEVIFNSSNDFIKLEILKTMQSLSFYDEEFIFSILKSRNFEHRKISFLILAKNSERKDDIANIFLEIDNLFGLNGRLIKENLDIVTRVPFKELKNCLVNLSNYKWFWNKSIREAANKILIKINEL